MATVFRTRDLPLAPTKASLPEFAWHTSPRLSKEAAAKHLQFDVRSLDPDRFSFPYHFHRGSEELFVILSGEATLRSPSGFQRVAQGDLVFFEEGATGAHQLYNHSDAPCVYLDLRSPNALDICEYPDSGKVALLPYRGEVFGVSSKVDYYQGEEGVRDLWPTEILRNSPTG